MLATLRFVKLVQEGAEKNPYHEHSAFPGVFLATFFEQDSFQKAFFGSKLVLEIIQGVHVGETNRSESGFFPVDVERLVEEVRKKEPPFFLKS